MAKITDAAAILLVSDVTVSANWYRDKLGFTDVELYGDPAGFAIIRRDGYAIMLQQADPKKILPNWKIAEKTSNIFFWVDDVRTIYAAFIASGATIDYELYTAPWGGLEFGINDPDEYDITFAQIIS